MKFKLTDTYVYWWPIKVDVPSSSGSGKVETQTFEMQFEAMPNDEIKRLDKELAEVTDPVERERQEYTHLTRICRDWRGVASDDIEEEVPFSVEALTQALQFPFFKTAVLKAYAASVSGDKARRGN